MKQVLDIRPFENDLEEVILRLDEPITITLESVRANLWISLCGGMIDISHEGASLVEGIYKTLKELSES